MKKKVYLYLLTLVTFTTLNFCMTSCGGDDEEGGSTTKVTPLPQMNNVSLSYCASVETVTLPRDVQAEGATMSLKKEVSWINDIQLSGNKRTKKHRRQFHDSGLNSQTAVLTLGMHHSSYCISKL